MIFRKIALNIVDHWDGHSLGCLYDGVLDRPWRESFARKAAKTVYETSEIYANAKLKKRGFNLELIWGKPIWNYYRYSYVFIKQVLWYFTRHLWSDKYIAEYLSAKAYKAPKLIAV